MTILVGASVSLAIELLQATSLDLLVRSDNVLF